MRTPTGYDIRPLLHVHLAEPAMIIGERRKRVSGRQRGADADPQSTILAPASGSKIAEASIGVFEDAASKLEELQQSDGCHHSCVRRAWHQDGVPSPASGGYGWTAGRAASQPTDINSGAAKR